MTQYRTIWSQSGRLIASRPSSPGAPTSPSAPLRPLLPLLPSCCKSSKILWIPTMKTSERWQTDEMVYWLCSGSAVKRCPKLRLTCDNKLHIASSKASKTSVVLFQTKVHMLSTLVFQLQNTTYYNRNKATSRQNWQRNTTRNLKNSLKVTSQLASTVDRYRLSFAIYSEINLFIIALVEYLCNVWRFCCTKILKKLDLFFNESFSQKLDLSRCTTSLNHIIAA